MSTRVTEIIRDWLAVFSSAYSVELESGEYAVYLFQHPAADGIVEFLNTPELSQDIPQICLTVLLDVPPIRSLDDAVALLELSEWLTGIALVIKECSSNRPALQLKLPPEALTGPEVLTATFNRLIKAKAYFETE